MIMMAMYNFEIYLTWCPLSKGSLFEKIIFCFLIIVLFNVFLVVEAGP